MSYAIRLAILLVSVQAAGCLTPCQKLAASAVAVDKDCAWVSLDKGDGQLAAACASAYGTMKRGLTTGKCATEVGAR